MVRLPNFWVRPFTRPLHRLRHVPLSLYATTTSPFIKEPARRGGLALGPTAARQTGATTRSHAVGTKPVLLEHWISDRWREGEEVLTNSYLQVSVKPTGLYRGIPRSSVMFATPASHELLPIHQAIKPFSSP